jgi:hypothetical protein
MGDIGVRFLIYPSRAYFSLGDLEMGFLIFFF